MNLAKTRRTGETKIKRGTDALRFLEEVMPHKFEVPPKSFAVSVAYDFCCDNFGPNGAPMISHGGDRIYRIDPSKRWAECWLSDRPTFYFAGEAELVMFGLFIKTHCGS